MSASGPLDGGCLCGTVRYRILAPTANIGHCHCRMCQRASGAAFVTWMTLPAADVVLLSGSPAVYRSSALATRSRCPACGSQLFFRFDGADEMDVTIATLDEPDRAPPAHNTWVGSRRAWAKGFDRDLPDFDGEAPPPG